MTSGTDFPAAAAISSRVGLCIFSERRRPACWRGGVSPPPALHCDARWSNDVHLDLAGIRERLRGNSEERRRAIEEVRLFARSIRAEERPGVKYVRSHELRVDRDAIDLMLSLTPAER